MTISERYEEAKKIYKQFGTDTDKALEKLLKVPVSIHCWQGDDVIGFDGDDVLSGGIQTTGNYPGKATSPSELMADMEKVIGLVPGRHKLNLHASYAIAGPGEKIERDNIKPEHFTEWVRFAKKHGMGIDFNPTLFAHRMVKDGLTLSSPVKEVREYWIRHCKCCLKISEYFAEETGEPCVMNIWIPDGFKDIPADRFTPRRRFKDSLDEILSSDYDKTKVFVALESKVFGIGVESYTVGSSEFCINYASQNNLVPLMDNGHYHPTEMVSDKISSMLLFFERLALHITRPVRWDSDHVVLFDDETKAICNEIVANDALDKVFIASDYFDAGINRISAWTVGLRNIQKGLLNALLTPHDELKKLQECGDKTRLMALQEEIKTLPFGDVWNYYCFKQNVPDGMKWFDEVKKYEEETLLKRNV